MLVYLEPEASKEPYRCNPLSLNRMAEEIALCASTFIIRSYWPREPPNFSCEECACRTGQPALEVEWIRESFLRPGFPLNLEVSMALTHYTIPRYKPCLKQFLTRHRVDVR